MVFNNISFIKPDVPYEKSFTRHNYAPMFRKRFWIEHLQEAKLYVCGLGYGYYCLNGQKVSNDLFTAPVSNYNKTLWYNVYDVTHLLKEGENIIAVWCGNGWYNEDLPSPWNYDEADWRDVPKFILRLDIGDTMAVCSDESWKCTTEGPIWFNALRSGEYFDARKFYADWAELDFDDGDWKYAVRDSTPPLGIFRECKCEPIREFETYSPIWIRKVCENKYLFDLGQNIAGYIRLRVSGERGQALTIRYAEQINDNWSLQLNRMNEYYPESDFQTDRFICSGKETVWSPKFTYHGFRYMEIEGLTSLENVEVCGVFVHQAVGKRTEFQCSDEYLNKMFQAGQYSVYSNMFYMMTDCPTREKLGWTNDAQSSTEQILTNFKAGKVLEKWLSDIYDAMQEVGALPGIIPTPGWGYAWGNGPVSDGILFEIPYRLYLHTGNAEPMKKSLPYFERYLAYLKTRTDDDGYVRFGLWDWAKPGFDVNSEGKDADVPLELINALLIRKFYHVAAMAAELSGGQKQKYEKCANELKQRIISDYIDENGSCRVEKQTAIAMLIYYNVYERLEPLKCQLQELIEESAFHHDCGMVGLRRLYMALNKCGLEEYAYRIITASGYPGYREWFEQGATTLWEYWDCQWHADSKNHHMYSDFMSWMIKTILGIRLDNREPGGHKIHVTPYFFEKLDYAKGSYETYGGILSVSWKKEGEMVRVEIDVPKGIVAVHGENALSAGKHIFIEEKGFRG